MVDIKKQVAETSSRKSFRPFKRNPPSNPKPPNTISNVESDVDEEEVSMADKQIDDEETVEVHGMLDFILLLSDNEESQEALPVATRSKSTIDFPQTNPVR